VAVFLFFLTRFPSGWSGPPAIGTTGLYRPARVEGQRRPAAARRDLVERRVRVVPGIPDHVDGVHLVVVQSCWVADRVGVGPRARSPARWSARRRSDGTVARMLHGPVEPPPERSMTKAVSFFELSVQVTVVPPVVAVPGLRPNRTPVAPAARRHHLGVHHVHLLVAEDVAVVHVLPAEVDVVVDDVDRLAVGVEGEDRQPSASCCVVLRRSRYTPSGIDGSSRRMLLGRPPHSSGICGMIGRSATMVSSSGLMRTVSFQPSSVAWACG
jgi:hypothetical protein